MRRVRSTRRRVGDQVALLMLHGVIASVLVGVGLDTSVAAWGILAGLAFILFFSATSIAYIRKFGTESVGATREGPVGIGRIHVLFAGNAMMGYLVILAVLAPTLIAPGSDPLALFWSVVGLWILLGLFFVVFALAVRQRHLGLRRRSR